VVLDVTKLKTSTDPWEEPEEEFLRRSREEMVGILGEERLLPKKISPWLVVKLQSLLTILFTIMSVLISNEKSINNPLVLSVIAGGIVGVVPTSIFALRLTLAEKARGTNTGTYVVALVSGEFIKIVTTVCLVVAFAWFMTNLHWLVMLGMYVVTLKCYWLAWFIKR
jgi:ATP synthase protein I